MKIVKESRGGETVVLTPEQLADINRLSRRPLKAEEVYPFAVRLCDNQVDRDGERFPRKTLEQLAPLFVGKAGLFDHNWSAQGQTARIYRTELVEEDSLTDSGERCCWLKGYAYMLRSQHTAPLIAEIEAGIKKEVSVGCAVERRTCSVCGQEWDGTCGHEKGKTYDGVLCYVNLEQAVDAYEFSFVAVPAQPKAGVVKGRTPSLKEAALADPNLAREWERLEQEARWGRDCLAQLREQVVRLARLEDEDRDPGLLQAMVKGLDGEQLLKLKKQALAGAARRYPLTVQLAKPEEVPKADPNSGAFLI